MNKNRLEAFSDGILAIIITIMVLELKVPENPTWKSYLDASPVFLSYILSFILVGLYWSTHFHLFEKVHKVDNKIIWKNMIPLFWQSLVPFTTATMGENNFSSISVTVYALVLTMATLSHIFLVNALVQLHGADSAVVAYKLKNNFRGYFTLGVNVFSTILAYVGYPKIAFALIATTALFWFLPEGKRGQR